MSDLYIGLWLWWMEFRDWVLQIAFCHENAEVIADFEHRMAYVLTTRTRGMSKPYYTIEAMQGEIDEYISECCDEAVDEYKEDIDELIKERDLYKNDYEVEQKKRLAAEAELNALRAGGKNASPQ